MGVSIGRSGWLTQSGTFEADFYPYVRRRVPIVSNGVSAWVDLSSAGRIHQLEGGSNAQQTGAERILKALDARVYEFDFEHGAGIERLSDLFFLNLYTLGRFACEMVPFADGRGIAYIGLTNPYTIRAKREGHRLQLYQRQGMRDVLLPMSRFFYAALDPDEASPLGVSLLDSIGWVLELKEKMLEDMAKSSHNAGYPRLHIKIEPPAPVAGESQSDYTTRANKEFDDTVEAFRDLSVEDNVFTWGAVTVEIVGSGGSREQFSWTINSERVVEDVIAGLHLFPWVLGYSFSTTKNWVDAQVDVLFNRVARGQMACERFLEWVQNTELAMRGLPTRVNWTFGNIRDPGELVKQRALQWRFQRVDDMVNRGYYSPEQGARELGLARPFNAERVLSGKGRET